MHAEHDTNPTAEIAEEQKKMRKIQLQQITQTIIAPKQKNHARSIRNRTNGNKKKWEKQILVGE